MKQLIIVSDWASDTAKCQEVYSVLGGYGESSVILPPRMVHSTSSSIHASFLTSQIAYTEMRVGKPLERVIVADLLSPKLFDGARPIADSHQFVCIKLSSGMYVLGNNRAYLFSLLSSSIERVFTYSGADTRSVFPARDSYMRIAAHFLDAMEDELDLDELPLSVVPRLEGGFVGHLFKNIVSTTVRKSQIDEVCSEEDEIPITIGDTTILTTYISRIDEDMDATCVLVPGAFGPIDDPYMDIVLHGPHIKRLPFGRIGYEDRVFFPGMKIMIPDVC